MRHQQMDDATIQDGRVASPFDRPPGQVGVALACDKPPCTTRRGGPHLDIASVEIRDEHPVGAVNPIGGGEYDVIMVVFDGFPLVERRTREEGLGTAHWVVHAQLGVLGRPTP